MFSYRYSLFMNGAKHENSSEEHEAMLFHTNYIKQYIGLDL